MDDSIPPGPLTTRVRYRMGAEGESTDGLKALVEWAEAHSPVADAVRRAVPVAIEIELEG